MPPKSRKYGSYNRIHKGEHPSDLETAKIRRESARSARGRIAAEDLGRAILAAPEDDALADAYRERLAAAERDARNAKGHKRRLQELQKDKDFV